MPDLTAPDQQVSGTGNSGQQEDYKPRYDGLVRKVEQLTLSNRDLVGQLEAKASELEQLRAQLTMKDVEKLAAVGERDKQIQSITTAKSQADTELNDLRALRLKVTVINEMKRPDLLRIADKIPAMSDPEALKSIFADMASFADEAALEREKQLKAGMTGSLSGNQKVLTTPSSEEGWTKHIESLPLGPERDKAYDGFWDWASKQQR